MIVDAPSAPFRFVAANHPVRETIQTRFPDLDAIGHLDNVAYAALFEIARIELTMLPPPRARAGDPSRAFVAPTRSTIWRKAPARTT